MSILKSFQFKIVYINFFVSSRNSENKNSTRGWVSNIVHWKTEAATIMFDLHKNLPWNPSLFLYIPHFLQDYESF